MTEQAGPDPLAEAAEGDYIEQRIDTAGVPAEPAEDDDTPWDATEADVHEQGTQA